MVLERSRKRYQPTQQFSQPPESTQWIEELLESPNIEQLLKEAKETILMYESWENEFIARSIEN